MNEKQFANITVKIWRLRQQASLLRANIQKRGYALKRRNGDLRLNPSVPKLNKLRRSLAVLARALTVGA